MKAVTNQSGFTFLEMCMVVAIIGVLLLMAVPNYQKAVASAQAKSCAANKKLVQSEVDSYYVDNNKYPVADSTTTEENETIIELVKDKYLQEEPKCPSGGKYQVSMDETTHTVAVTCTVHDKPSP